MVGLSLDKFDKIRQYCRKLGHDLPFEYCRNVNKNLPCSLALDCWYNKFDIAQFLKENYTDEQMKEIKSPQPPKMTQIFDIMSSALKKQKGSD